MSKLKWHSGPPPYAGWWRTNNSPDEMQTWRWWDGNNWSFSVFPNMPANDAEKWASRASGSNEHTWCDYWPKNARVPRIKL